MDSNITLTDSKRLIQQLSSEKTELLIPAIVFIAILMVLGLIGNTLVCFYFIAKAKSTTTYFFVTVLAIYDLFICSVCMPGEIVDIAKFYTYDNGIACKALRFLNYFASIGSVFSLVAIAADRFRKIGAPTGKQMSLRQAKMVVFITSIVAVVLAAPTVILQGAIEIEIPNNFGVVLKGHDCTTSKLPSLKSYVFAYNILFFALFLISIMALVILYSVIGTKIYKHKHTMAKYKQSQQSQTKNSSKMKCQLETSTSLKDQTLSTLDVSKGLESDQITTPQTANISRESSNDSVRVTLVMLCVTSVFVISFVPHFALKIWRSLEGKHTVEIIDDSGLVWYVIGTRSYLLNSSLNPWIYGIFNSDFRQFVYRLICCKR